MTALSMLLHDCDVHYYVTAMFMPLYDYDAKPLNYESSSMRNDYILKITLSPSLRNRRNKKKELNEKRGVIGH